MNAPGTPIAVMNQNNEITGVTPTPPSTFQSAFDNYSYTVKQADKSGLSTNISS